MVCLVLRERVVTMVLRVMLVLQDLQEQLVPLDLRCDYFLYHLSPGTTRTIVLDIYQMLVQNRSYSIFSVQV